MAAAIDSLAAGGIGADRYRIESTAARLASPRTQPQQYREAIPPTRKTIKNPDPPEGFVYREDFVTPEQETALTRGIVGLPLKEFEFHGYFGKRSVVSFGWHRDKAVFEDVVAISLLTPCSVRLSR